MPISSQNVNIRVHLGRGGGLLSATVVTVRSRNAYINTCDTWNAIECDGGVSESDDMRKNRDVKGFYQNEGHRAGALSKSYASDAHRLALSSDLARKILSSLPLPFPSPPLEEDFDGRPGARKELPQKEWAGEGNIGPPSIGLLPARRFFGRANRM